MASNYTENLNLRKPSHRDPETFESWDQVLNSNFDVIDAVFGSRSYTEENYIDHTDSHGESLNKLDIALKDVSDTAPTINQKAALDGEGTPSATNKYATKDYVRVSRKEVFFPEFAGATFVASPGGANTGNMTTDMETHNDFNYNFYKWVSDEVTFQSYDISFQWRVPETFLNFNDIAAIIVDICTEDDSTADNKIDIILSKDGSATTSSITYIVSETAGDWASEREGNIIAEFFDDNVVISNLAPGNTLNILIRMYSQNSKYVKIGAITIEYVG